MNRIISANNRILACYRNIEAFESLDPNYFEVVEKLANFATE